jgi:hypothetical protein
MLRGSAATSSIAGREARQPNQRMANGDSTDPGHHVSLERLAGIRTLLLNPALLLN